jgi:hypothetical protein
LVNELVGPEYDKVREELKMSRTNTVNMAGILRFIYSYPNALACTSLPKQSKRWKM